MDNQTIQKIAEDFLHLKRSNPQLSALENKLKGGKADYLDADKYALESAKVFGKVLQGNLGDGMLTGEEYQEIIRMVLPSGMYELYEDVSEYAVTIQKGINQKFGVGLKAMKPDYNAKEVAAVTDLAAAVDSYKEAAGQLTQGLEHYAQNVATDTMKVNARIANDVGLEPVVTRVYDNVGVHTQNGGKYKEECEWCRSRAGVEVPYAEAIARDMFRRHPGCGCIIEYIVKGKRQIQTNWRANQWSDVE